MNDLILTLAIIAQITGLTLPQIIDEDYYLYSGIGNNDQIIWQVAKAGNNLPYEKNPIMPRANSLVLEELNINAKAAITADAQTGTILWEKNANEAMPIASITKLMNSLVFVEHNPGLNSVYNIKADENSLPGAKLAIENNQPLTTIDLLRTTLVGSANNTAKALARSTGLADEQYIEAMNDKAKELSLANSNFVDPTGLEEGNQSSVSDLVVIFRNFLQYPALRKAAEIKQHCLAIPPDNHEHCIKNTNKLMQDQDVNILAGKTGFTYEAGYCLIVLAKGENGQEIIAAVLGLPDEASRDWEIKKLVQWTFDNYTWQ